MNERMKIYNVWTQMRYRCNSPSCTNYRQYGGRGIKVCERWNSFENFYNDMGPRPVGATLERIDNDQGYYPENCKWILQREQLLNRRAQRNNKTGITGIFKIARDNLWRATGSRSQTLYEGKDFFLACCARKAWENVRTI